MGGGATAVLANQPISAENSIISPQNIAITICENKLTPAKQYQKFHATAVPKCQRLYSRSNS